MRTAHLSGSRASQPARLVLIAGLLLCAIAGFLAGRLTGSSKTFKLIGRPVDVIPGEASPIGEAATNATGGEVRASLGADQQTAAASSGEFHTVCGARTKSGTLCTRKVRGGGYCWQHRQALVSNVGNSN